MNNGDILGLQYEITLKSETKLNGELNDFKVLKSESKGKSWEYKLIADNEDLKSLNLIDGVEIIKKSETHQMKYEYEVFASGTPFEHTFVLNTDNQLLISAFWHAMTLLCEKGSLGGKSSIGLGSVNWDELKKQIPENANGLYLNHLKKMKPLIENYFYKNSPIKSEIIQ